MPHHIPWTVHVREHPGSTKDGISNEPDWSHGHQHRIGFLNRQGRLPGVTHQDDEVGNLLELTRSSSSSEPDEEEEFDEQAKKDYEQPEARAKKGDLISFRDLITNEKDFHLRYPENRSLGWRYLLEATEDWVKNEEDWPANIEKRKKEEAAKKDKETRTSDGVETSERSKESNEKPSHEESGQGENDWKRKEGENSKHHDAYAADDEHSDQSDKEGSDDGDKCEYQKLLDRYSPQEIALLRALQHEKDYRYKLQQNDGKRKSPPTHNRSTISIDEQDQFSPDSWLPRSGDLIRLTGKHPMNAEADLKKLFVESQKCELITPNELHYIRNHGAVPRLLWEFHKLDVEDGKLTLCMNDLKDNFEHINIPVALACDGNRRKELNMIRKSKGFSWGAGATGCAYLKGPLLRDVLEAAGVKPGRYTGEGKLRWVNFQGADDPSEGKYETCIPLDYAMDPTNDVILALYMNDVPLPPDHGYPVRLLIPGYVGGRCVKWLSKIWITDYENQSHYHIWDNRVLPSFITQKDGEFANAMFAHPDTACNEQNLNSVIVKPAQSEKIPVANARHGQTYRIEGYAYDGGGHEVQRVEISLDGGNTWLYCIRKFS
ncbi:Nitrate reductase [NADH] 1 [Fulvia fulva]|uniref:Nitrate reductase [NADH] 1 n=1 Tax=Passalora fulva TaxID=5499 RepID=A0A9Q8LC87_PASFU|nr:Nitrate reductase [NADH] 1 [Fulvia fulva]KAK4632266.1 Nitrate reductase [NADH] 1 [Fulvia fulva]KAK4633384.1 Nitrate reductase [NADH] 1 [Fulvia fulva]UJO14093.1 Nitrate reductase [NADH] 1 [Fulvia fulva]WPV11147.1 Nitrate reductase [NADH] 1 [Fulvia fulva]WPV26370.1 Nitrate reductase [NADH] 1 [Fulvia fulva]